MQWRLADIQHILHWAETGYLDAQQVQRLEQLAPLRPSRAQWLLAGECFCTLAGAALLALAVVFFFAWNWDDLHRFSKLALAGTALTACVVVALYSHPGSLASQSALFAAAICTGALLALIGQIYQTGANIWELFAAWSVLMLPFALLARAFPLWLMCLVLSNLAVQGMLGRYGLIWQWGLEAEAARWVLPLLALNGLWWAASHWLLLAGPRPHLERIAAFATLAVLAFAALMGSFSRIAGSSSDGYAVYLPLFALVAAGAWWWYRTPRREVLTAKLGDGVMRWSWLRPPDIVMLAIIGGWAIMVSGGLLAEVAIHADTESGGLFVLGVYLLAASSALVFWLRKVSRDMSAPASEPREPHA